MDSKSNQCRVCLKFVKKTRKLLPLFSDESQNAERIFLISGIQVNDYKEHLPDKICYKCSDALMYAVQIRSICIESDKLLKKQLMDLNMLEEVEEEVKTEGKVEIVQQSTQEKETYNDGENIKSERVTSDEDDASNFTMPLPAVELHKKRSVSLSTKKSHVPCEVCGKEYTRSYIATHLRTHLGDEKAKNFSCDLCGLNFSVKPYIYSHMINIHCASKKWVCNICGKSYAKKNTWAGHLRNHSGEEGRIFKCTYQNCGKRFAQQNKLNVHLRIHNGVRPYVCVHCGRGFIHYTDHRRHVYGHTGERPYRCAYPNCGRGFIKKSELTAHERTHQR